MKTVEVRVKFGSDEHYQSTRTFNVVPGSLSEVVEAVSKLLEKPNLTELLIKYHETIF